LRYESQYLKPTWKPLSLSSFLILLPIATLIWDYYENQDIQSTSQEAIECFAWPAGIFVVKHFRPNPF